MRDGPVKMQQPTQLSALLLLIASVSASPIDKTIDLLKDLQTKIENDDDKEKDAYRKYVDFCNDAPDIEVFLFL